VLSVRSAWKTVAVGGTTCVGGYFLLPGTGLKDVAYSVIGVASVVCVVVAVRLHRPEESSGWYAIAAGNACFVVGDGVFSLYRYVAHRSVPFPSWADAAYLLGYPFLVLGVVLISRHRQEGRSRESFADAAIVATGALALSWHFLVGDYVAQDHIGSLGKLVNMAYPLMDLAVLFIVVRCLLFGVSMMPTFALLATSMISMTVADFAYDVLVLHGVYRTGQPVDAGWLFGYVFVGAAALHPSMARADGPSDAGVGDTGRRLPLVALAAFVSPCILLAVGSGAGRSEVEALAGTSIAVFVLVVVRMRWMFRRIGLQTNELEESLTTKESLEADLRYQVLHDGLTGLANRALLYDRVEHALLASVRSGKTVAVCFCDLDGFKTVNDGLGHQVGDQILVTVSKRLSSVVRPGDTVARLGGDEFAVLIEGVEDPSIATSVADRIVSAVARPIELEGRSVDMTVSVGIAVADGKATGEELLSRADSAMYEAKAAGKGRYEVFEASMHARIMERLEITNSFGRALKRSEFALLYQPQFSLVDGHLEGFEALLRWQHPSLGLLSPDRFISLAEETGHIVSIGRWVLETACDQAARWSTGRSPLTMSVNISARQLRHPHLVDDVRTALALAGLPPCQLVLEITENVLVSDPDHARSVLGELKGLGVRLAIDDFGTGYSSLSYLRRFPVDLLKIDKSFIDPLSDPDGDDVAFIKTILKLADTLGLATVAEGIERPDQRALLSELGCGSAQGFLMARPLSDLAAGDLIDRSSSVPRAFT
jgi:diguanylate cyclase (GGDEF)-like protein